MTQYFTSNASAPCGIFGFVIASLVQIFQSSLLLGHGARLFPLVESNKAILFLLFYLFILVADSPSHHMVYSHLKGFTNSYPVGVSDFSLTHLQFAYDTLLFSSVDHAPENTYLRLFKFFSMMQVYLLTYPKVSPWVSTLHILT